MAAPLGMARTVQPAGGRPGCNQSNAPVSAVLLVGAELLVVAPPPHPPSTRATVARPSTALLEIAVSVAGATVVVCVTIAGGGSLGDSG